MKYGVIPANLLERLALATGKVPIPAIDALYGPMKARIIMAGVRLGVFAAIDRGVRTPAALAAALSLDEDALDLLLRTLVQAEYLVQRADGYALSSLALATMRPAAPRALTGFLEWNYTQWHLLERLEDLVRTGRGADFHVTMTDDRAWRDYQRAMFEVARIQAPVVARKIPVPTGATRMLDLAGSHGLFSAEVCRRHPPLRATVIDLPQALPHAQLLAREAGVEQLVDHREGDVLEGELGDGYHVALLANILHHFQPPEIGRILDRVRAALVPGATVAIWELERPKRGSRVTDGEGAALFFAVTSTGRTYHGDEYVAWLAARACDRARVVRPRLLPGYVLVTARAA